MGDGIVPRQHGNICKPTAARSDELRKRKLASAFIQNFAENNVLVLPGRMTNYKNPDLKLLPSSMTKKYVYGLYVDALKSTNDEPMSLRLWYQTRSDLRQNVVVQLQRSDLWCIVQAKSDGCG